MGVVWKLHRRRWRSRAGVTEELNGDSAGGCVKLYRYRALHRRCKAVRCGTVLLANFRKLSSTTCATRRPSLASDGPCTHACFCSCRKLRELAQISAGRPWALTGPSCRTRHLSNAFLRTATTDSNTEQQVCVDGVGTWEGNRGIRTTCQRTQKPLHNPNNTDRDINETPTPWAGHAGSGHLPIHEGEQSHCTDQHRT